MSPESPPDPQVDVTVGSWGGMTQLWVHLFLRPVRWQVGGRARPGGAMDAWIRLGCQQDMKGKGGSAAAPGVAFPAEHLAASRGFGIMTDYSMAGFGESRGEGGGAMR